MSVGRQGLLFLLIGAALFTLDWLSFVTLTAFGLPVVGANVAARVLAALMGFWLNGRLTFAGPGGPRLGGFRMLRFVVVWLALMVLST
ncbi:MAG TPA: GtrA family protein, partial [Xanthomonadales bacterium]|nr:GtrA family protein [Xanthomonadales bacterium]